MKKKLYPEIDILKALAALIVVLIHTVNMYTYKSYSMYIFWDLLHFSVGIFALASGFLFSNSSQRISPSTNITKEIFKRFKRIAFPFYKFAILFVVIALLTKSSSMLSHLSLQNVFNSVFLFNGVTGGYEWIPRLFLTLSVISLITEVISKKFSFAHQTLFIISVTISIYLVFNGLPFLGQFDNIFGWLVIYYVGYFLNKSYSNKNLKRSILISLFSFGLLYYVFSRIGNNTAIFSNKYPPNIYFISYNIMASTLVFFAAKIFSKAKNIPSVISNSINFLSKHSYEIFFYHIIVLEMWHIRISWFVDYLIIVLTTILSIILSKKLAFKKMQTSTV